MIKLLGWFLLGLVCIPVWATLVINESWLWPLPFAVTMYAMIRCYLFGGTK